MRRLIVGLSFIALAPAALAACGQPAAETETEAAAPAETAGEVASPASPGPVEAPAKADPAPAATAGPRQVRCVITASPENYEGPCLFTPDQNGSFAVAPPGGREWLGGEIGQVAVFVLEPGVADVRGLTKDGINSRWGRAQRSTSDPACWDGSDFRICAY